MTGWNARRERLFKAASIGVGLAIALAIGEVALRVRAAVTGRDPDVELRKTVTAVPPTVFGDCSQSTQASLGQIVRPSVYPGLVYELKPSIETCYSGAYLQTNALGVRSTDQFSHQKPLNVFRILLLGDSQTFGWGVSLEQTFGAVLARQLHALSKREVEVVNAGVPGYNTAQEAEFFRRRGLDFEPDCAMVLFIQNDFGVPYLMLDRERALSFRRSLLLDTLRAAVRPASSRYDAKWRVAQGPMATSVGEDEMHRVSPQYRYMVGVTGYRRALQSMAETAQRADIPLVNFADYRGLGPETALELDQLHTELGIVRADFRYPVKRKFWLRRSDPHLNPDGHRNVAGRMLRALKKVNVCLPPLAD